MLSPSRTETAGPENSAAKAELARITYRNTAQTIRMALHASRLVELLRADLYRGFSRMRIR